MKTAALVIYFAYKGASFCSCDALNGREQSVVKPTHNAQSSHETASGLQVLMTCPIFINCKDQRKPLRLIFF